MAPEYVLGLLSQYAAAVEVGQTEVTLRLMNQTSFTAIALEGLLSLRSTLLKGTVTYMCIYLQYPQDQKEMRL